jgi:tetratricopeptide (TPR) repeat protein
MSDRMMNEWSEAEKRVERAHELYESGRWEDALRELRAAIGVNPYQGEWHFNMGLTLEAMGRYEQAIEAFKRALDCDGDDLEALNVLGINCSRMGRLKEALGYFEQAEQSHPDDPASYANRVEVYARMGEHDLAEQMFYLAVQLDDRCVRAYLHIATSLSQREDHQRALWCLNHVRRLDPADDQVHARLAQAYWAKGDHDRAYNNYLQQLRYYAGDLDTLLDLGNLLTEMNRPVEAAEKYRRVIELDPTNADAHFFLGELALQSGSLDAAHRALQTAAQCDANRIDTHLKLAQIALHREQHSLARQLLKKELQQDDQQRSEVSRDQLGQLLLDARMAPQAAEVLTPLVKAHPQNARLLHQLAVAHLMMDDLPRGMRLCRRVLRLEPEFALALHNLAVASIRLGHTGLAGRYLQRALQLDPRDRHLRSLRRKLRITVVNRAITQFLAGFKRSAP